MADGHYSFTADNSVVGTGAASAIYTVTDGDGDTSTAGISFAVTDANVPTGGTAAASVDDDGLAGGNPANTIGDIDANTGESPASLSEAVYNGTLGGSVGGDGAGSNGFSFATLDGTGGTVGQESVTYSWDVATDTLTATGPRGDLFTVHVTDPATGAYTVTLLDNVLQAQGPNDENNATVDLGYVITDADGSTAPGTLTITFNDDAPTVALADVALPTLTVDESFLTAATNGGINGSGQAPAGSTHAEATFSDAFTVATGADGGTTSYALSVAGGSSGLVDTASGLAVILSVNASGVVEGHAGAGGALVFTVSVDANGKVSFDLDRAVHEDGASNTPNDGTSLSNLITLTATVTDGDGDKASQGLNLGSLLTINDDGPSAISPASAVVSNGAGAPVSFDLDIDGILTNNYGADGGTVIFPTSLDGTASGLTSNGVSIVYDVSADGHTLTGLAGLTSVFVITLNPATASYSVDMNGTVDSVTHVDFSSAGYNFVGGNGAWAGFIPSTETVSSPIDNNSSDLLITPEVNGVRTSTINASAISGGVGSGSSVGLDGGLPESMRVDFVTDLRGDPAGSGGYSDAANRDHVFDGHYTVNGSTATFTATNGSTIRITASDDPDGDNIVGGGSIDHINSVIIGYNGVFQTITATASLENYTINGHVYTVQLNVDGSVNVGGVYGTAGAGAIGTEIAVFTNDGYNSVEYTYVSGDTFKVGDFGAAVATHTPVSFDIPVSVVDGDGDIAGGTIGITLSPTGGAIQDHSSDLAGDPHSYTSTLAEPHIIGSDFNDTLNGDGGNNVLYGGAGADTINGGAGNDLLIGGSGQDTMTGGTGADTFKLDGLDIKDLITDYNGAQGDKIDLSSLFETALGGNIADFVKYDSGTHTLSVDTNGTTGGANFVDVAVLQNAPVAGTINLIYDDTAHTQHTATI
ncbi:DUF5801 repeats-in-toxin domain-containing protein [Mesorhizobium sp. LNHC252B00]|uniref:DUF5801 repeats-in-toxin domain-containing protein n=1 Tax=Mesorhizobium sp. LNHC252B00 TaxID=1287252 RepID=UPI001FD8B797|nr:DUF5801 repeats-in-toxin domain-containing protein [Mesorhizobium sp. LNHC252B00]